MRALIVDLNNFALYPSIAVGYLVANLRRANIEVDVMAPMSNGVKGVSREPVPPAWGWIDQAIRYGTGVARNSTIRSIRKRFAARMSSQLYRSKVPMVEEFTRRLDEKSYDVVLISTYLMYFEHCFALGEVCHDRKVALVLGGPYFSVGDVAREWMDIPGLTALVGGEVDLHLDEILKTAVASGSFEHIPGVWNRDRKTPLTSPPLTDLDSVAFPDYTDFPWHLYPNRIVPLLTGRGCGWGVCTFCSDITSTAGRTFRSRSTANVLDEIARQASIHDSSLFVFTDLKLNSDLQIWHAIIGEMQRIVPGARWIGSVHVGNRSSEGLSLRELQLARKSGMVRLTTGMESGSKKVLSKMAKGTDPDTTSRFLLDARTAGISVRITLIIGYPGENSDDVNETSSFLEKHECCLERINLNRFQIMSGTYFGERLIRRPEKYPEIIDVKLDHRYAQVEHHNTGIDSSGYRRAVLRLLRIVNRINRRQLTEAARSFEGVM